MKFSLQWSTPFSREQLAIINAGRDYVVEKRCTPGSIPIGVVPYCEAAFGQQPGIKNFYPTFLSEWFRRRIKLWHEPQVARQCVFAKSATEWKSDVPARVYDIGDTIPAMSWVSDVVGFCDEWRYYVANGKAIAVGWYQGNNEDATAPEIDIEWPDGFSGAVDFGTLKDGSVALVECHAPFACGWYGDDPKLFAEWQEIAWNHAGWWKI